MCTSLKIDDCETWLTMMGMWASFCSQSRFHSWESLYSSHFSPCNDACIASYMHTHTKYPRILPQWSILNCCKTQVMCVSSVIGNRLQCCFPFGWDRNCDKHPHYDWEHAGAQLFMHGHAENIIMNAWLHVYALTFMESKTSHCKGWKCEYIAAFWSTTQANI